MCVDEDGGNGLICGCVLGTESRPFGHVQPLGVTSPHLLDVHNSPPFSNHAHTHTHRMQAVVQQYEEGLEAALALALEEDTDVDEERESIEASQAAREQAASTGPSLPPAAAAKDDGMEAKPTPSMPSAFNNLPDVRVDSPPSAFPPPPLSSLSHSFPPSYYSLATRQTQDILCRLLIYAGTIHGKVSKRWERVKVLGRREGGREGEEGEAGGMASLTRAQHLADETK